MAESVMIVEDEGLVALELQESLRQMGYHVPAVAGSGAEAIERAAEFRPDLVLMDIRLKGDMDGIEAARCIMNRQGIPVVYLTAHSDDATVSRAAETSPFGYVLKPWEEKSLQIGIDLALRKSRAEAHLREERDWYLSVLRYTGAPMLACDDQGKVRFLNAAAEQLMGAAGRDAVGRPLEAAVDLRHDPDAAPLSASALREAGADGARSLLLGQGPVYTSVEVDTVPISGEAGEDLGLVLVMRLAPAGDPEDGKPGAWPVTLYEYLQAELVRLLILRDQGQPDPLVDGQLQAYRRLMRDFLGRALPDSARVDWKEGVMRRAVHDAHAQTRAVLLGRPEITVAGRLVPARLARYLEVLCQRLGASGASASAESAGARVEVGPVDLGLDAAIYCVLIVNEILGHAFANEVPRAVSIGLSEDGKGLARLEVSMAPQSGGRPVAATSVLNILVSELGASLSIVSDERIVWTIRFPIS